MADFKPQIWNGEPIPYDASVADVRSTVEEPGPKAWAAIRALADKPDPEALTTLVQLTHSSDPHLRRSAVEALGIHYSGQSASEVVCHLLHDRVSFVARAAVDTAAKLQLTAAHGQVVCLVKAAEDSTKLAALRALESLWKSSDFELVFDLYLHDPSKEVRKQAAWTLQKNVGADHWEHLFSAWSTDPLPRHRVWACQVAEMFGSATIIPALHVLCADQDGHVRGAASQAVARLSAARGTSEMGGPP
ncbi:MAG TPA: HEAT repeat domain-containing protein [Gemmataceae bacterium]|nr:HEAT repeat domain-containing protein [Gemmataceae bacterium]